MPINTSVSPINGSFKGEEWIPLADIIHFYMSDFIIADQYKINVVCTLH